MPSSKIIPKYTKVQVYTQTEEDELAMFCDSSTDLHIFNSTLNKSRIWNGTAFENTTDIDDLLDPTKTAKGASNLIIVKSASDLPQAIDGIRTLADNHVYIINGIIDIGTDRIVCGVKNTIRGNDRLNDKLVSSTTGTFFTVDNTVIVKASLIFDTISLSCPNGTLFNYTGSGINQLTLITTTIFNTKYGGNFTGVALSIRTSSISNCFTTNGFVFIGSNTSLVLRDSTVSNNVGTFVDFSGCTALSTVNISRSFITVNSAQTFINCTGLSIGIAGQITLCFFMGVGTFYTGITPQSTSWLFNNNHGLTNTSPFTENLTNQIDGSNAVFTTQNNFIPENVEIHVNGIKQNIIIDYQLSNNNTITFTFSPSIGEYITITY